MIIVAKKKIEHYKFLQYINKNYKETYEELDKENKKYISSCRDKQDWLGQLFEKMKKNYVLDILKRFENIKKTSFSFAFFAYLIFEKTETTLKSIKLYFPNDILSIINEELEFILDNIHSQGDEIFWTKFNECKLYIIKNLYGLFISKKEEIKKNVSMINLSKISPDEIKSKVHEIQTEFYSYNSSKVKKKTMTDSIDKLSQNIEKIIQEISKSKEEEDKNNKEKEKKENEIPSR